MYPTLPSSNPQYPQPYVPPYPSAPPAAVGTPLYPQPYPTQQGNFGGGGSTAVEWSTGLCHCCADPGNCCITCFCPCITLGQIVEVVDRGSTSCALGALIYCALALVGCQCIYSYSYRSKLRNHYALNESLCGDRLTHCFCDMCALCQEYRELKLRGTDPSIGWLGNVEKWNRVGTTMSPPAVASVMMR